MIKYFKQDQKKVVFCVKKILCILFILVLCLCSCQKQSENNYRNDVLTKDIASEILERTKLTLLTKSDEGWVASTVPIDIDLCEEFEFYMDSTNKADLMGIFKAKGETEAQTVFEQSKKYLEKLETNWLSEYSPEELPKIQNAFCEKYGNYIVFFVFDEDSKNIASNTDDEMVSLYVAVI